MITGVPDMGSAGMSVSNVPESLTQRAGSAGAAADSSAPFGDLLKDAIGKVSQLEDQARTTVDGLMSGSGVDVHQAMIASEKASMAFEMALAVRNKAIQSYQSVMSMQF